MKCHPHRISKRFVSLKERMLIFGWRVEGFSIRDIARQLGGSPRAVSRELKRNGMTSTCYNEGVGSFVYEVQSSITKESAQQ